jgi:hypothetical protein
MSRKNKYTLTHNPIAIPGVEVATVEDRGAGEFRRRWITARALSKNPEIALEFSIEHYTAKRDKNQQLRYRQEYVTMEIPREHFEAFLAEINKGAKFEP